MSAFRIAPVALAAFAALIALSGCTPPASGPVPSPTAGAESPTPTPSSSADPTPEPDTVAMPDLRGTEVVLVTTTVTAPNGAELDLAMTTYYPVTVASPEGQAILAYLRANGDTTDVSDDAFLAAEAAILQLSTISAVDASPGTAWPTDLGATPSLGPALSDTLVGLPITPNTNGWPQIVGAGSGYGVAALYFPASDAEVALEQWPDFWTFYGFANRGFVVEVSNCEILTTELTQESPAVFTWEDVPYNCEVGIGH